MLEIKRCIKCGVEQFKTEFHKDQRRPDGLFPYCKRCRRKNKELYDEIKRYEGTGLRRCSACRVWKTTDSFYRNPARKDGVHHQCKPCAIRQAEKYYRQHWKELNKRRYWGNPDKHRASFRKYYAENVEKMRKRSQDFYYGDKDKVKQMRKSWMDRRGEEWYYEYRRSEHGRFITNKNASKRRERIKENGEGTLTLSEWKEILDKQNHMCLVCKRKFSDELPATMDHIVPVIKGGILEKNNVQGLCRHCNSSKGIKTIDYRPYFSYN